MNNTNSVCNPMDALPLLPYSHLLFSNNSIDFRHRVSIAVKPAFPATGSCRWRIRATAANGVSSASTSEIDMVRNREGVFTAKHSKVVVLWDLDNKPPRGPPYEAAMALKRVAQRFGHVVDMSAYANRHAFIHLPQWVVEERRERRQLDILERKGLISPSESYVCGVCGRKCKTNLDLKKHFKQLHERERQKKLNRMRSLKGKKRQRYKERFISGNEKYNEAARSLITPKVGYGLASELRRAGVFVKTVEDKPQAADWALKRQMQHSMSRGIDWMFLVSDDSDFSEMLRKAKDANLGTVVVGDRDRALGRHADLWVPWISVESGNVTEEDLVPKRWRTSRSEEGLDEDDGFSVSRFYGDIEAGSDLESVVEELASSSTGFNGFRISAFSEGEDEAEEDEWAEEDVAPDYLLEMSDEEDGYF